MSSKVAFQPRFVRPPCNAESPENYQLGGLCPVRLGQRFRDRYRVLRKVGWGTRATVWLARDERYVVLKVGAATGTRMRQEVEALQQLTSPDHSRDTVCEIQKLHDDFECSSANGAHHVLVLEPHGRTLEKHSYLSYLSRQSGGYPPLAFVKEVARQIILGLQYIHASGVVHRDLQPANIMFVPRFDLQKLTEPQVRQCESAFGGIYPVERLDGKPSAFGVPEYVVNPWPLDDRVTPSTPLDKLRLVITDFGAASTFANVNDGGHAFPVDVQPPELVLGMDLIAPQADIWGLGCVIFELVMQRPLFTVDQFATAAEQDNEYLQCIVEIIGPLPGEYLSRWERRSHFVHPDGSLLEKVIEEGISEPLEDLVKMCKPTGMDEAGVAVFLDFLHCMLRVDANARVLTHELLDHPWLRKG